MVEISRGASDFDFKLATSAFTGVVGDEIRAYSEQIGDGGSNVLNDLWGLPGSLVHAIAPETWEAVSTSANDTAAGIGAQEITIEYLDINFIKKLKIITMNGTSPVSLVNSDFYRFRDSSVAISGSLGTNDGLITIRVSGGGANRGAINYSTLHNKGLGRSQGAHYTVEAGKKLLVRYSSLDVNKGDDIKIWPEVRRFGSSVWLTSSPILSYQQSQQSDFANSFDTISEKTDFRLLAASTNPGSIASVFFTGYLINT